MAQFKTAVITNRGMSLMSKVISGQATLNFTKIATSNHSYSDSQLAALTVLADVKQEALVSSVEKVNDTNVKVSTSFSNLTLNAGYYVKAIGLYAIDPALGEILYSVCIANEAVASPDYMPAYNNVGVSSLLVNMVTAIGNAANVSVSVDPAALATVTQVQNLQDQIDDLKGYVDYTDDDIYGVEVDFKNKTMKRLGAAVGHSAGEFFDDIKPWGGRKRCMISNDGYRLGYYGDAWYTETGALTQACKINTTPDAAEPTYTTFAVGTPVQVMVEQPKFYVKVVPLACEKAKYGRGVQMTKARFYVSPNPKPGFVIPEIFKAKNGVYQDFIYLSAFEGSVYDTSASAYLLEDEGSVDFTATTGDKLCSIAGAKPASGKNNNLTRANCRILAKNRNAGVTADSVSNGLGWRQHDIFAMSVTQILSLVEYATFNVQGAIGQGVCSLTDDGASNMAHVTGGTSLLGNASGNEANTNDGKHSVTYRGEENLWGNIWTWLDGINIECKDMQRVLLNPNYDTWADDTASNYDDAGFTGSWGNGYVSAYGWNEKYPYILFPTEVAGASNLPVGAYHYQNHSYNGFMVAQFGGGWDDGAGCGWDLAVSKTSSSRKRTFGGRLLYVPQADKPKYYYPAVAA